MGKKLFIGNLPFSTTEDSLREKLSEFGTVTDLKIIIDRNTGRSRGFAFAEMDDEGAEKAMAFSGQAYEGRNIIIREARPMQERQPRGSFNQN